MKKEHTYCIFSIFLVVLGSIFTLFSILLKTLLYPSKTVLLIFSFALILIGSALFAVHNKKLILTKNLLHYNIPVIAKWTYPPNSSPLLAQYLKEQKNNDLTTSSLILTFAIIFFLIFAYSGGTHIFYLGYTFITLCIFAYIITLKFISRYYDALSNTEITVLFGADCIYFLDEIYTLNYSIYLLQNVNITIGTDHLLIFEYGLNDIDDDAYCHLAIPIPKDKFSTALHLKEYYRSIIQNEE